MAQVSLGTFRDLLASPPVTPVTQAQKDIVVRAVDNIIGAIGLDNVRMFLPMWETSGDKLHDLIHPDLTFSVNGATLGQPGLLGNCLEFNNSYCLQDPIVGASNIATSGLQTLELTSPTAVAVQKLKPVTGTIGMVRMRLVRKGSPTGYIRFEVREGDKNGPVIGISRRQGLGSSPISSGEVVIFGLNFPSSRPRSRKPIQYYVAVAYENPGNVDGNNNVGVLHNTGVYGEGMSYSPDGGETWTDTPGSDLIFDAYNDYLNVEDGFSWITVHKCTGLTSELIPVIGSSYASANVIPRIGVTSSGVLQAAFFSVPLAQSTVLYSMVDPLNNFIVSALDATPDRASFFVNGTLESHTSTPGQIGPLVQPVCIGTFLTNRGEIPAVQHRFKGLIGPIIAAKGGLSNDQIGKITQELLCLRIRGLV